MVGSVGSGNGPPVAPERMVVSSRCTPAARTETRTWPVAGQRVVDGLVAQVVGWAELVELDGVHRISGSGGVGPSLARGNSTDPADPEKLKLYRGQALVASPLLPKPGGATTAPVVRSPPVPLPADTGRANHRNGGRTSPDPTTDTGWSNHRNGGWIAPRPTPIDTGLPNHRSGGLPRWVGPGQGSQVEASTARCSHQVSSAGSPTAFSHPNTTIIPIRDRPS